MSRRGDLVGGSKKSQRSAPPLFDRRAERSRARLLRRLVAGEHDAPDCIDRYHIVRELGEGSTGTVFEVADPTTGRRLALKELRYRRADDLYRLKREFRTLTELCHENVVELHELVVEQDMGYFTMELIDGQHFVEFHRARLATAAKPLDAAGCDRLRGSLRQLASALLEIHAQGGLHRDIKPSNVMVTKEGRVVILDFGLATAYDPQVAQVTAPHAGSVAYMAPEQLSGDGPLLPAADAYAVGVVLHETLTGARPHNLPWPQLVAAKSESTADPRVLHPELPDDLCELCKGLLEPDPQQRTSLHAVESILRETIDPTAVPPPTTSEQFFGRAQELARLHREAEPWMLSNSFRALVLSGSSGIGKSALLRRFATTLRTSDKSTLVLSSRCYHNQRIEHRALDGIVDELSAYWKQLPRDEAAFLMPRRSDALVRLFPVLGRVSVLRDSANFADTRPLAQIRTQGISALREVLARICGRRHLMIAIDDTQWLDAESRHLLASLMRPPDQPELLLVLSRRDCETDCPGTELEQDLAKRQTPMRHVALGPLNNHDAAEAARALIGPMAPPELCARVTRAAGGVPFLLCDLAQHGLAEGLSDAQSIDIDTAVRARLKRLPKQRRALLELVASAFEPLAIEVLAHANTNGDTASCHAELRALQRSRHVALTAGERAEYVRPYHDRIREVISESLSSETQRIHHRTLARAFAAHPHLARSAEQESRHWLAANEEASAARSALRAAEQAYEALALARAAQLYGIGLQLSPGLSSPERARLLVRRATCSSAIGRGAEAADDYLSASELLDDRAEILELKRLAMEQLLISGHITRGVQTAEQLGEMAGFELPRTRLAILWRLLVGQLGLRRSFEADILAPPEGGPEQRVVARISSSITRGLALIETLRVAGFGFVALDLAQRYGDAVDRICALCGVVAFLSTTGGPGRKATLQRIAQLQAHASRVDSPTAHAFVEWARVMTEFEVGHWRNTINFTETLIHDRQSQSHEPLVRWLLANAQIYRHWALAFVGDMKQLREDVERSTRDADERHDRFDSVLYRSGMPNMVWLAVDEPERARLDLQRSRDEWPLTDSYRMQHVWIQIAEAHVALYLGQPDKTYADIEATWGMARRAMLLRIQHLEINFLDAHARLAIMMPSQGRRQNKQLRRRIRSCARRIESHRMPWSDPIAKVLRAGLAAGDGQRERSCGLLRQAEREFTNADMLINAHCARLRYSALEEASIEEPTEALRALGVVDPPRFARVLVP